MQKKARDEKAILIDVGGTLSDQMVRLQNSPRP